MRSYHQYLTEAPFEAIKGDCFRNANKWNAKYAKQSDFIVHGVVTNGAGSTFPHAWIERGNTVIDPTTGATLLTARFYDLLHVRDAVRYTSTQAIRNQVRAGHHGPWTDADLRAPIKTYEAYIQEMTPGRPLSRAEKMTIGDWQMNDRVPAKTRKEIEVLLQDTVPGGSLEYLRPTAGTKVWRGQDRPELQLGARSFSTKEKDAGGWGKTAHGLTITKDVLAIDLSKIQPSENEVIVFVKHVNPIKSYESYITELFDKPAPLSWSRNSFGGWAAQFMIGDTEYFVDFEADGAEIYRLVFGLEDETVARKYGGGQDPYAVNAFGVLGTGKSYDVFSSVIAALKEFIRKVQPFYIYFSAHEPSRKKLYDRFMKLVTSMVSGYKGSTVTDRYIRDHSGIDAGETLYAIEKIRAVSTSRRKT